MLVTTGVANIIPAPPLIIAFAERLCPDVFAGTSRPASPGKLPVLSGRADACARTAVSGSAVGAVRHVAPGGCFCPTGSASRSPALVSTTAIAFVFRAAAAR
jgi:hypothetical protein